MMTNDMTAEFFKTIKTIPTIDDTVLVSINFFIIHPISTAHGQKPKNSTIVKYSKRTNEFIEILIQSPKKEALRETDLSKLKSKKKFSRKVYTNYEHGIRFFPTSTIDSNSAINSYTFIEDEKVITVATDEDDDIKSIKTQEPLKFDDKAFEYVHRIPNHVSGFTKCSIYFNAKLFESDLSMLFLNVNKKTEINVEIIKDEDGFIKEIISDLMVNTKKINDSLSSGKIKDTNFIFSKLNKNTLLIAKCLKGDDSLLIDFGKKILMEMKDDFNG